MSTILHDDYGFPITFECVNMNVTDPVTPVEMTFYYDMAHKNTTEQDVSRAYVEGSLVQQLAAYYGFWGGHACNGKLSNRVWFVKLSSLAPDIPNPNLGEYHKM